MTASKTKTLVAIALVCACGLVAILGPQVACAHATSYTYSNMTDSKTRSFVSKALRKAGVPKANITLFMKDVKAYNKATKNIGLAKKGFITISSLPYDPNAEGVYKIDAKRSKAWSKTYPSFDGYNCRITAFTLMKGTVSVKARQSTSTFLIMDQASLDNAPTKHFNNKQLATFATLFDPVMTPVTKSQKKVVKLARAQWQADGVKFSKKTKAKLVTVRTHMNVDNSESELDAGHAGVLVPSGKGYLFIEKLSFEAPYQVLKFRSLKELKRYLIAMYQSYTDPQSAKPFVMVNYTKI